MSETQNEVLYQELLKAKDELISAMREFMGPANQIAAALLLRAEQIKPELGEGFQRRVKRIMYKETPASGEGINKNEESEIKQELAEKEASIPVGKRACSICRKPGHRRTNCPEIKVVL